MLFISWTSKIRINFFFLLSPQKIFLKVRLGFEPNPSFMQVSAPLIFRTLVVYVLYCFDEFFCSALIFFFLYYLYFDRIFHLLSFLIILIYDVDFYCAECLHCTLLSVRFDDQEFCKRKHL